MVLDPLPPRRGVRTAAGTARFAALSPTAATTTTAMTMIDEAGLSGLLEVQLGSRAGIPVSARDELFAQLGGCVTRIGGVLVSAARLAAVEQAMLAAVAQHHADHPLEEGMPREELRERLLGDAPAAVFEHALRALVDDQRIVARERVALTGRSVTLSDEETRARDRIVHVLSEAGLAPPDATVLATRLGIKADALDRIASLLVRQNVLVRAGDLLFDREALRRLEADVRSLRPTDGAATLDVAAFKDRYHVSRKYAIPLLEFLDRERVTRRVGDTRHVL